MWCAILLSLCSASYLPGVTPMTYNSNSNITVLVNKLDSSVTQLPFNYYYLNFCKGKDMSLYDNNLGQVLTGVRQMASNYIISINKPVTCQLLCERVNNKEEAQNFKWMIDNEYKASWSLDGLPAGVRTTYRGSQNEGVKYSNYDDGFPIGASQEGGAHFIYNHLNLIVQIHQISEDKEEYRVIGFLVEPLSVKQTKTDLGCATAEYKELLVKFEYYPERSFSTDAPSYVSLRKFQNIEHQKVDGPITYSYSVIFERTDREWAYRWDQYLSIDSETAEVHWLSIVNSFGMVLFLSGMVAHILIRTIKKDISKYKEKGDLDPESELGWKQIRGEVFRPPTYSGLFCIFIGSGVQLLLMGFFTLLFSCLGFLSPRYSGNLLTAMIIIFAFLGSVAGYTAARFYRMFDGKEWKKNALGTAFLLPGFVFTVFFIINSLLWAESSSGAVPFLNLLSLLLLWFGVSVPLVVLGHIIGYRRPVIENPAKVNRIPKPLTLPPGLPKLQIISLMAGSLPFGCMFIELNYIMQSIWHHSLFYYLFGFLFLCYIVLALTSAEVSILMSYILLCKEDYRWWWNSFSVAGISGVYLFGYSVIYFWTELGITRFSSLVIYFGYMGLMSVGYGLITGTVGFLASFIFVRVIYNLIKSD